MSEQPHKKFKLKGWQVLALLNFGLVVVCWFLARVDYVRDLDRRLNDYWMNVRYLINGPKASPDLALIGIDDKSRDPTYSELADPWNAGGWRTRLNYVLQLELFRQVIHPKVVAYDILFPSDETSDRKERSEDTTSLLKALDFAELSYANEAVQAVEAKGNEKMTQKMIELQEAREEGVPAPEVALAYRFPTDVREPPVEPEAYKRWRERNRKRFDRIKKFAFPDGIIENPGRIAIHERIEIPPDRFFNTPAKMGAINTPRDADGTVRQVPLLNGLRDPDHPEEVIYLPSLAFQALLSFWGINVAELKPEGEGLPSISFQPGKHLSVRTDKLSRDIPVDEEAAIFLNQTFKHRDIPNVSFVDFCDNGLQAFGSYDEPGKEQQRLKAVNDVDEALAGRIALVAEMGTGALDIGNYALESYVPNGMAHLYVMDNILREDYIDTSPAWTQGVIFLFLGVVCTAVFTSKAQRLAIWFTVALIPCYLIAFGVSFSFGLILPVILPLTLLLYMFTTGYFLQYREVSAQRQLVRQHFSQMVDPSILELIEKNPDEALKPSRHEATMMFSDLAGFTAFSENLAADQLSIILNRYLSPMAGIIKRHKGYVDKYNGDGVMADWGVPLPLENHALHACEAALEQLRAAERLSPELEKEFNVTVYVRIGVNSGLVSVGPMGSDDKRQYTVMGDSVNLAARLEPANKDYQTRIIIGENTHKLTKGKLVVRMLDRIVVKGKTEPVEIYELLDAPPRGAAVVIPDWIPAYEAGYSLHVERKWKQASAAFEECMHIRGGVDTPSIVMLARIAHYEIEPPPDDWRGEYVRKAKD